MSKNLLKIVIMFCVLILINAELPLCMRRSTYYLELDENYIVTKSSNFVYFKDYELVINSNDTQHTLKLFVMQNDQKILLEIFVSVLEEYFKFQLAISNQLSNLNQHQLANLNCNQNESFHGSYLIVNGTFNENPHLITKQGCKIYNDSGNLEVETVTIILIQDSVVVDEKFYINEIIKKLFQLNNITFDHFFFTTSFCMYTQVKSYVKDEQDKVMQRTKQIRIFLMFLVIIPVVAVGIRCSNKMIRNNRIVTT